jgi:protein-S-isoprenylcysteine O-methyltransferase Ste14
MSMSKSESGKLSLARMGKYRLIYGYFMCAVALVLATHDVFLPGMALALLGIALRIWSAGYIEKNSRLATGGPYSLCRNPLYIVGFALFYWPTIANEQRFLMGKFGDEYAGYCRRVPSFIPWKFSRGTGNFSFRNAMVNREHLHALASVIFLVVLTLVGHFRA